MYAKQNKTSIIIFLMKIKFIFLLSSMFMLFSSCHADSIKNEENVPKVKINSIELKDHPRLLFTASEESHVKDLLKNNTQVKEMSAVLTKEATRLLTIDEIPSSKNDLSSKREYVYRMITLSLAYRLYGDAKYLNRVNQMLLWVCSWPDWNPAHYLDTAEMTTAVAIAYDWLYNVLPAKTKDIVKKAIYQRAIVKAVSEYQTGDSGSWAKRETNWNVVCNSGMTIGALAVAEDYPVEAQNIILNAVKYMPNCLKYFAEDGVCYEGVGYWEYTDIYLSLFLKSMNDNFSTDYGISSIKGVDKSALYFIHTLSPSGKEFGFADTGNVYPGSNVVPIMFCWGKLFNQPETSQWARTIIQRVLDKNERPTWHSFLAIPWYDEAVAPTEYKYPLLSTYHGVNDLIVFNGSRNVAKSIFLIAKGADPDMAHQQLDGGTFIVETEGVRWTEDLGSESYSLPGFWEYSPNGRRWNYFMNTNLSHNCLDIDGALQYSLGTAHISEENKDCAQPNVVLDMTSLYEQKSSKTFREFKLFNDKVIEMSDKVELIDVSSSVCWQVVTKADVEINGNIAKLSKDGKTFFFKIMQPQNATFSLKDAKPNDPSIERAQNGVHLLQCVIKSGKSSNEIVIRMGAESNDL